MGERRLTRDDHAASDFVAAVLMVMAVVILGSVLTVIVGRTLSEGVETTEASFSLGSVDAGDGDVALVLQNGNTLDLGVLRIGINRDGAGETDVPRASWTTPDPSKWSAGDRLSFSVSPAIAADESISVRIYRTDANSVIATLTARTDGALAAIAAPSVQIPPPSPPSIPADATATSLVTALVAHPEGVLAISQVTVDFGRVGGGPVILYLNDDGSAGDVRGGDGVWSGLLRFPINAVIGTYQGIVNVTDASGRITSVTTSSVLLTATSASSGGDGGGDGGGGDGGGGDGGGGDGGGGGGDGGDGGGTGGGGLVGSFDGNSSGNFSGNGSGNFSGDFSGDIDGAFIGLGAGKRATEGTRFKVPTSENVSRLTLVNWSFDRLDLSKLNYDSMVGHVLAGNKTWSFYLKFDYSNENTGKNNPRVTNLRVWSDYNQTYYKPATGTILNLTTLSLNLLAPTSSGLVVDANPPTDIRINAPNAADPYATYRYARVTDNPFFVLSFLRDEQATGTGAKSIDTGIFGVDVEFI